MEAAFASLVLAVTFAALEAIDLAQTYRTWREMRDARSLRNLLLVLAIFLAALVILGGRVAVYLAPEWTATIRWAGYVVYGALIVVAAFRVKSRARVRRR